MKKNQANWTKWYLTKMGKEWSEEDESGQAPDLSSLTPKEAEVGALLYRRYIREKQDAEAYLYDKERAQEAALEKQRAQLAAAQKVRIGADETALSRGRQGTDYARDLTRSAARSAADKVNKSEESARNTQDKLLASYAARRDKSDKALAADLDSVDAKYRSLWRYNWAKLKENIETDLQGSKSKYDPDTYTVEGVNAAKQRIEEDKQALGDLYDTALAWADALPVFDGGKGGAVLSTSKGDVYVDPKDLRYADLIHYRRGAGSTVTKADVFSVEYNETRYYLRGDTAASAELNELLDAIARYKQMPTKVGTLLYYHGKLYIYDGESTWLGTRSVGVQSSPHTLDKLLKEIKTDMAKEEG